MSVSPASRLASFESSSYEVLEAADDAFYILDGSLRLVFCNARAEQYLGRPEAELLDRNIFEEFPDAKRTPLPEMFRRALAEDRAVEQQILCEEIGDWFSVRAVPRNGRLLVFLRAVTEHKFIEDRARQLAAQDAALRDVATAVVRDVAIEELFEFIAGKTGELLGGEVAGVLRLERDGESAHVAGAWAANGTPPVPTGREIPDVQTTSLSALFRAERPAVAVNYSEDSEWLLAKLGYRQSMGAALHVKDRVWGALVVASKRADAFSDEHLGHLRSFAELLELALTRIEDRERLAAQATTDPLTGLINHRAFHERLHQEVMRAHRHSRPLAVALIDVDEFKTVNDTFGHQQGDRLLTQIADSFRAHARSEDVIARIGGDEFALLLPDTTKEQAAALCERLRDAFTRVDIQPVPPVTLSVGITDLADAFEPESMVRLADGALYWSKAHGRDRVCVYDPAVVLDLSARERAEQLARSQTLLGLRALARAIDAKDPSTRRHSDRVAHLAGLLAEQLGWDDEQVRLLREAALLHDVGKLGVPDAILLKPSRLDDDEYEQVKHHAALGADIVDDVLTADQVEWVLHHHERPDGRGYPQQITEDEITAGAALLAIADAFDVMTASRPYQPPKTITEALNECRALTGRQFTQEAVQALEAVITLGHLEDTPVDRD